MYTVYIRYIFGREITKYTVTYGVYTPGRCHVIRIRRIVFNVYFIVLNKSGHVVRLQNLPICGLFDNFRPQNGSTLGQKSALPKLLRKYNRIIRVLHI